MVKVGIGLVLGVDVGLVGRIAASRSGAPRFEITPPPTENPPVGGPVGAGERGGPPRPAPGTNVHWPDSLALLQVPESAGKAIDAEM